MNQYVYLPVPEELIPDALRWLQERLSADAPAVNQAAPTETVEWTAAERQRAYTESSRSMRTVFDYLAQRPGQDVPTLEIAKHMGLNPYEFRAVVAAFGKRVAYSHGKTVWPFDSWRRDGVTYYRMSTEVLSELTPVLGEVPGVESAQ